MNYVKLGGFYYLGHVAAIITIIYYHSHPAWACKEYFSEQSTDIHVSCSSTSIRRYKRGPEGEQRRKKEKKEKKKKEKNPWPVCWPKPLTEAVVCTHGNIQVQLDLYIRISKFHKKVFLWRGILTEHTLGPCVIGT